MTYPIGQFVDTTQGRTSTSPFITIQQPRNPTGNDLGPPYKISQRWINTVNNKEWYLESLTSTGGIIQANWQFLASFAGEILTINDIPPDNSGNFEIVAGTNINIVPGMNAITINASTSSGTDTTAFYAYLSAPLTDVTGDTSVYIIPYNSVIYNQNSAYNTAAHVFTAPESGVYNFASAIDLTNLQATHTDYQVHLAVAGTSSGTYLMNESDAAVLRPGTNSITVNSSIQVFMTAGDTAQLTITVGPAGQPKVVGVNGGSSTQTGYFSGSFVQPGSSTAGISWILITASQIMSPNIGYICVSPGGALQLSLPFASLVGDIIEITLRGATSWKILQGFEQRIWVAATSTTLGTGGSLSSTNQGNTIRMVCTIANFEWTVLSMIGNLEVI